MYQNKIKILHIGDLHLAREFSINNIVGEDFSERREEIWSTFESALKYSEEINVELVLISGDLYENKYMTKSNLDRLAFIFRKYSKLRFLIVLGNHDYLSSKSDYLKTILPKNVHIFSNRLDYIEYKKVRIYGYSWDRVEINNFNFQIPLLDDDYFNILLIHGTNSKVNNYLPLDIEFLENYGFDYLALGHIHQPGKVGENAYYCGSLEPLSFGEMGIHGGYVLQVNNKDYDINFKAFAKRSYSEINFDTSEISTNSQLFSTVYELLKEININDIIRLNMIGRKDRDLDFDELQSILLKDYKFIKILDSTKPNYDFVEILDNNRNNLIGKYFEYVFKNFDEKEQRELVNIGLNIFPIGEIYEDKKN